MKKIFIEAHKMTREMVKEYEVDYQTQFGLNLSYLLNKEEEESMNELVELKGSEKQVKWANDIRRKMITTLNYHKNDCTVFNDLKEYWESVNFGYDDGRTNEEIEAEFYNMINSKDAKWFIDNRSSDVIQILADNLNG